MASSSLSMATGSALLALVGLVCLPPACASSSADGISGDCASGLLCDQGNGGSAVVVVDAADNAGTGGGGAAWSAYCGGLRAGCNPDEPTACASWELPSGGGAGGLGTAGTAGSSGGAGSSAGTAGGAGTVAAGGDAGAAGVGSAAGAAGAGESGAAGASSTTPVRGACRPALVQLEIQTACEVAGIGADASPCLSGADCAPGLACVGESGAGQCRPFCCSDPASCAEGAYCTLRRVSATDSATTATAEVPVCIPADNCSLDEPYPCTDPATCVCGSGTYCSVVRSDGTTACLTPGVGTENQTCPCATGYICSPVAQLCMKLCKTAVADSCGATGLCQRVAAMPNGYGVCALTQVSM
jgi:hypothetical protein